MSFRYFTNKGMSGVEFLTYLSGGFLYFCLMVAVIFPLYFKFSFSKVYILSNLPFYVLFVHPLRPYEKNERSATDGPGGPVSRFQPIP